ncbi:unnamed protein product [Fusarium fujikuroi]|uniref:F-box domain-containing protein n=1 Tax=Fusarium fujikuroi TaxID=5127 RepID=A0A9Q9RP94_FUSFU|nr:hypothetical protein CEK25_005509 [Fusarium fujikuroi]SCO51750.1 uncharacterized protein FFNC_13924 [Fusarium fujikuroi]VTT69891.1 unnamed protein product [Fusarium fujikuroi]VZI16492.1 unnamed protein product [Fusarium fujikuroi]
MGLLSLPPEIIDKICKLFCTHCQNEPLSRSPHEQDLVTSCPSKIWEHDAQGVKALLNLSETCQALNTLTLPHRYHRVEFKSDLLYTKQFIAHIRGRGHDALKHVRSLSLSYTKAMDDSYNRLPNSLKRRFNFFDMVLRHVPQIQILHIRLNLEHEIKVPRRTTLESLRYIHIERADEESDDYTHSLHIDDVLQQAPKIHTLVIQVTRLSWSFGSGGLQNVKCLKLVDTLVKPELLEKILESCPQLESFVFIFFGKMRDWSKLRRNEITTLRTLPHVLSLRQETLRYVELYWEPDIPWTRGMEIVGCFKGLTSLETLILGGPGLRFERAENHEPFETCLVDLLPQSIRSVAIDSGSMNLHKPISALGEAVKWGSFPMLREIRCYQREFGGWTDLERTLSRPFVSRRQVAEDWSNMNRSLRGLLSQLSRTCNVSFSAETKRPFGHDAGP